jgi:hypothetical protein
MGSRIAECMQATSARFRAGARDFVLHSVQTDPGTHTALYLLDAAGSFLGAKLNTHLDALLILMMHGAKHRLTGMFPWFHA